MTVSIYQSTSIGISQNFWAATKFGVVSDIYHEAEHIYIYCITLYNIYCISLYLSTDIGIG